MMMFPFFTIAQLILFVNLPSACAFTFSQKSFILDAIQQQEESHMFRMWGKLWKDNHLLKDMVAYNSDYSMSRTAMVFQAVEEICQEFDLSQPIWLDANVR